MPGKKILVLIVIAVLFAAIFLPIFLNAQNMIGQAKAELDAQHYAEASAAYARAAKLLFWRDDLWEQAAIASARAANWQQALTFFKLAPASLTEEGWIWLGSSYLYLGDFNSATLAFQQGLKTYNSPELHGLLALAYRQQKNWDAERSELQAQLLLDTGDSYARYRLGLLLTLLDPDQALTDLMLASSLNPQLDPAVQTLRTALNLSATQPDSAKQMISIGRALGLVQEWDLAISAFEKAIALDAENAEAWAWLGEAKQQTGQSGSADLDRALEIDHTSAIVRALRGLYWRRQEKYPQMLAEYLLAAEYDPQNPAWQAEIGNAYIKLGDLASALNAYQHAAELAPSESTYWRLLAVFCAENSVQLDEVGLPAAEKAASLAPDDPSVLDALGWVNLSSGRFASAEKIFLDVNERFPEYLPAYLHLAMNYMSQGNNAAAFETLTYVQNADPDGASGKEAARLLQQYFP